MCSTLSTHALDDVEAMRLLVAATPFDVVAHPDVVLRKSIAHKTPATADLYFYFEFLQQFLARCCAATH